MLKTMVAIAALQAVTMLAAAPASAQTAAPAAADSAAIRRVALDYIDGWYTGDAARMRGALHPQLAKRIVRTPPGGASRLGHMTADQLVEGTAQGGGRSTPEDRRRSDVRILDIFGAAASVRVDATDWVDYLHLVRTDAGWVIVNVLWELRR